MLRDLGDYASILRVHIIAIAVLAALVFGKVLTGAPHAGVALLAGLDWLLINLLNRVSDVTEDTANRIPGTERVAARPALTFAIWLWLLCMSFLLGHFVAPELTGWRIAVQLVGIGYSYRLVPTPRGRRRFKDIYFLKNFMSALLFVATCCVYPVVAGGFAAGAGWVTVLALALFFVPFEITYEILYDLRDLEGDRLANVPTYPVVHGPAVSARIIDALLAAAVVALGVGFALGVIGVRELLFAAAPAVQLALYKPRFRRGLTTRDCIALTWIGAALLALWLIGTAIWEAAGLPVNVWLG